MRSEYLVNYTQHLPERFDKNIFPLCNANFQFKFHKTLQTNFQKARVCMYIMCGHTEREFQLDSSFHTNLP